MRENFNRGAQSALLKFYGVARKLGVLSNGPGARAFEVAYDFYKEFFEAASVTQLRSLVRPESVVIDVGANIGFFTRRFAKWTGPAGRVIALEPEGANFRRLTRAMDRDGLSSRVEFIQAAVGEITGTARLLLNPVHPGDHRLATGEERGVPVPLVTIDDLLEARNWPDVSLVKIDVQGAEEQVLAGAERTLAHSRAAWFVEVDDENLRRMGSSAALLLERFARHGYSPHRVTAAAIGPALSNSAILENIRPGSYIDLLFLRT